MQALDGSSSGARNALMAVAADLKLPPIVVARALEYAFDNQRTFPNASQALCFGIVRQGYYVDTQIMDVVVQRLRRNFGAILGTPAVQHVSLGQWFAQPSFSVYHHTSHAAMTTPIQANASAAPAASSYVVRLNDGGGYYRGFVLADSPHVGPLSASRSRRSGSSAQDWISAVGVDSTGMHYAGPSGGVWR